MKKCPFCKAEIEEKARFCFYCMTPLEEKQEIETPKDKNRRWPYYILAAVLALVIMGLCVWAIKGNENPQNESSDTNTKFQIGSVQDASEVSTPSSQTSNDKQTSTEVADSSAKITTQNNTQNNTDNSNRNSGNNAESADKGSSVSNQTSSTTPVNSTTEGTASDNSTTNQPSYTYIKATLENTYPTECIPPSNNIENAIVITKVIGNQASGNYVIPDTIDGKRVVAIMPSAFSDVSASVKSVTLPSTVRTVWNDAFKNCYNLKDIYIKSAVIGIYTDAFPEISKRTDTLTINCTRNCRDFDYYYYRNIADKYGALYKEWNG